MIGALSIVAPAGALREAQAHAVGVSRGTYVVRRTVGAVLVTADVVFASADSGLLIAGERLFTVSADDVECHRNPGYDDVQVLDGEGDGSARDDGARAHLSWTCPEAARVLVVWDFLARDAAMGGSHRHVATVTSGFGPAKEELLFAGHDRLSIDVPDDASSPEGGVAAAPARVSPSFGSFAWLGLRHVLSGPDHLAFVLGLVLGGGALVELGQVVTAFTVAHSLTLALAAFGLVAPSARIVEPLVALSVVYIGVESFRRCRPRPVDAAPRRLRGRWPVAFAFGLVHGLAFAAALKAIGLHRGALAVPLVGFNVGVEIAQLAALVVFLAAIRLVSRACSAERAAAWRRVASAAVAVAGAVWFVLRVV